MSRIGGSVQHICYYSNKCDWSKAFIKELSKTPYKNEFMFICVDPSPTRAPLPSWLKKVPTLVVKGEPEPLTDGEVMNWLSIRRLKDAGGGTHAPSPNSASVTGGQGQGAEPEAYMWNEMGGSLTKSFSYVDDSAGAPVGNFEFLNGGNSQGTRTGSDMPDLGARGAAQKSRKEQLFDKQMESYMKSRDSGMPPPVMRQ
jgi:hypothetical protein